MIEVEVPGKGIAEFPDGTNPRDIEYSLYSTWPDLVDTPQKAEKAKLLQQRSELLSHPYGAPTEELQRGIADAIVEQQGEPFVKIPRPKLEPHPETPIPFGGQAIHTITRTIDTVFDKLIGAVEAVETPLSVEMLATGAFAPKTIATVAGLMGGGVATQGVKEVAEGVKSGDVAQVVGGLIDTGMGTAMTLPATHLTAKALSETPKTGVSDASKISQATEVYGNVRPREEPAQGVPVTESGAGVQLETKGRIQEQVAENKPAQVVSEQAPRSEVPAEPMASAAVEPGVAAPGTAPAISEPIPQAAETQLSAGPGAASPADFPVSPTVSERLKGSALKQITRARNTIKERINTGDAREVATYTRDVADNAARQLAREVTSEIRGPLRRAFGKEAEMADDALSFVVESGMTQEGLDIARQKVLESLEAEPGWRKRAVEAIDFAKYHLDELTPIAERFKRLTDFQIEAENTKGIDTLKRDKYVPHYQDVEGEASFFSSSGEGEATGFKKVRAYETFADSIAAGVDPKSLAASKLLEARISNGQRLINRRMWVEGLRDLQAADGSPIAVDPDVVKRADGSTYIQPPKGYSIEYAGMQPIAVKNGMEYIFKALTKPSFISDSAPLKLARSATQGGKSIALLFDTFHLGRISFWDALIKGLGVKTFRAPLPEWVSKKTITLMDATPRELRQMVDAGEIPANWLSDLTEFKTDQALAIKSGYNIGRVSDALYQDLVHKIPGIGHFNKWLFDKYQRSAMMQAWRIEYQRRRMGRPDETPADSARYVSKALNTRFGNLGRQGLLKSRSAQDAARLLFLAPQWNEGLIRSELGAVKETATFVKDVANRERLYAGLLMRSVGGMIVAQFAANQLINIATRGHPTWENPEEGLGAKISAWIPDLVGGGSGFFLHPLGLAAETTHLLTKAYERSGDTREAIMSYARSRVSTTMRPLLTFVTKSDFLGRTLKPGTVWGEMMKEAVPAPISGGAVVQAGKSVVSGKREEKFPGQFQKQALASIGIKTDQAPTPEGRIYALAKEFNEKKGVEPRAEFYSGDYSKLFNAVRVGNESEALAALEELRKLKTERQIYAHLRAWPNYPYTGSRSREIGFITSLSQGQLEAYRKAKADRREVVKKIREMLSKNPRKPEG